MDIGFHRLKSLKVDLLHIFLALLLFLTLVYTSLIGHQSLGSHSLVSSRWSSWGLRSSSSVSSVSRAISYSKRGVLVTPWPWDPVCSKYHTRFAFNRSLPSTALVSFPGSGNTWIRYMLESATGVYTGSMHNDLKLYNSGFKGEFEEVESGNTLVQKSHHNGLVRTERSLPWRVHNVQGNFGGRALMVIREPHRAILAYWGFLVTHRNHTGHFEAKMDEKERELFNDFALDCGRRWLQLIDDWLTYGNDIGLFFFERIAERPDAEVRKMVDFLNTNLDSEVVDDRLKCLMSHLSGQFKREKKKKGSENVLEKMQNFYVTTLDVLTNYVMQANQMLREHLNRELPLDKYLLYNAARNESIRARLQH